MEFPEFQAFPVFEWKPCLFLKTRAAACTSFSASDEIPAGFKPLMACSSWSHPGVTRGPHQHVGQDDYFIFAGPSNFHCLSLG